MVQAVNSITKSISTHSAREDGDGRGQGGSKGDGISTHSAREDGDGHLTAGQAQTKISTHSAREDGDYVS